MRIHAAVAQKERELIIERTKAALAAAWTRAATRDIRSPTSALRPPGAVRGGGRTNGAPPGPGGEALRAEGLTRIPTSLARCPS